MSLTDTTTRLAADFSGLNDLKREARARTPAANREVARQFEALMLQTMLKSMRAATPHDDLFNSEETRFYESMHDEQLAQLVAGSGRGLGLAALLEKQLASLQASQLESLNDLPLQRPANSLPLNVPANSAGLPLSGTDAEELPSMDLAMLRARARSVEAAYAGRASKAGTGTDNDVAATAHPAVHPAVHPFVRQILPHATAASQTTGIPAHFMVAQAALETGWGRAEPRFADGRSSHNLFGIKAGSGWQGPVVTSTTTEVVNGQVQRQTARFRAYPSYQAAFEDYARLLGTNPRYAQVLEARDAASFAYGLQRAGYATDPAYGSKLMQVMQSEQLRVTWPPTSSLG